MKLATIFLLALAVTPSEVRANSSLPLVAASSHPATADSSASPAPTLHLLGRWHAGPVFSSAVSGNHVYFGTGGGIRVLRIEQVDSTSWKEVASIATPSVSVEGQYAYLANGWSGLIISNRARVGV